MSAGPWEPDRTLSRESAVRAIGECFPDVDNSTLRHIGSGWEFDAYVTADQWVFRFPRRAECAELFDTEARVHRLVGPAFPPRIALPRVELMGRPTQFFPYRFAGHRFIAGIPADGLSRTLLPAVARDIALMLGAVHNIPEREARNAGVAEDIGNDDGRQYWFDQGVSSAQQLRGLDPVVDQAIDWLTQTSLPDAPWRGPLQLIHQDLSPDHVIVNPTTGFVTGVLDWTDAQLGDAARDFVFLAAWQGWTFVDEVLQSYPRAVDPEFRVRLRLMSELLTIMWLAYAHKQGEDLAKPVQWVRNVFMPRVVQ